MRYRVIDWKRIDDIPLGLPRYTACLLPDEQATEQARRATVFESNFLTLAQREADRLQMRQKDYDDRSLFHVGTSCRIAASHGLS
jgi:hypothetical protein